VIKQLHRRAAQFGFALQPQNSPASGEFLRKAEIDLEIQNYFIARSWLGL
jgi:hypothetical protein